MKYLEDTFVVYECKANCIYVGVLIDYYVRQGTEESWNETGR